MTVTSNNKKKETVLFIKCYKKTKNTENINTVINYTKITCG